MSSFLKVGVCAAAAASGALIWGWGHITLGITDIPSAVLLRSAEDFLSLRSLLNDVGIRAELESMCDCGFSLNRIMTDTINDPEATSCYRNEGTSVQGVKTRHVFEFAGHGAASSRVYALAYATCKTEPGN